MAQTRAADAADPEGEANGMHCSHPLRVKSVSAQEVNVTRCHMIVWKREDEQPVSLL